MLILLVYRLQNIQMLLLQIGSVSLEVWMYS